MFWKERHGCSEAAQDACARCYAHACSHTHEYVLIIFVPIPSVIFIFIITVTLVHTVFQTVRPSLCQTYRLTLILESGGVRGGWLEDGLESTHRPC